MRVQVWITDGSSGSRMLLVIHAAASLVCSWTLQDLSDDSHDKEMLMCDICHVDTQTDNMAAECIIHFTLCLFVII